jgi:hypothetical protein
VENNNISEQKKVNRIIVLGFVASVAVNCLFYFNDSARAIGKLQAAICMYLPYLLAMPIICIGLLIKTILRGKVPYYEWDIEHAKVILKQDNALAKKILALLFVLIHKPVFFIGGWAAGSAAFYLLIKAITRS